MNVFRQWAARRAGWILLGAAICAGCSRESTITDRNRYVPPTDRARNALEAVLEDWQAGIEPGPIHRLAVGVCVVDKQRKKGQTLEEFEILGEAPADGARGFTVRVKLSGPQAEEKVRFAVIGIDPLWVFRQEDFESISQWSCGKQEEEPPSEAKGNIPSDDERPQFDAAAAPTSESSDAPASVDEANGDAGNSNPSRRD